MFGTQVNVVTFIFVLLQVSFIAPSIISFLIKHEIDRLRFVILNLLFLSYNVVNGMVPDENLEINIISQDIVGYLTGITCVVYFVYYIYEEYNIQPLKILNLKTIIYILILDFILLFIIPYTATKNLNFSRNIFLVIPLLLAFGVIFIIFKKLLKDLKHAVNGYYRFKILAGGSAMLSVISLPFVIFTLGDNQLIEHSFFNIGFFMICISYAYRLVYDSKVNESMLKKIEHSIKINLFNNLSTRQKEIVKLICDNPEKTYNELAGIIYIQPNTFSSHATKIFQKLNLQQRNKEGLLLFFENIDNQND